MRSEDDDNMMGGASSGSISDGGGVLVEFLETEVNITGKLGSGS